MLGIWRLQLLREVARRGTLKAAAQAMSITPSAVSQQLAMLEREAGVKLIEKAGRGVRLTDPGLVLAEAGRALRPGGRLLVTDMVPHEREDFRRQMGHQWLGFGEEQLGRWLADAGFTGYRYVPLPADVQAKGPMLFAAAARAGVGVVAAVGSSARQDAGR